MPLSRATRLNRKIRLLPPRFNRYEQVMKDLLKESLAFTPLIESGTLDGHIFMDVTGSERLFGPSADVAFKLKKAFKRSFNFDPIWSVATNKLVAKVATRIVKPVGEVIVPPGNEQDFLAPLPIHLIPGLIKTDLTRLAEFNLFFVSQARTLTLDQLRGAFHQRAGLIYNRIRGLDPTPIQTLRKSGSPLEADHEFVDDTNELGLLRSALYGLVEKICRALRNQNRLWTAAKIVLSYSDGLQRTTALKLSPPVSTDMAAFKSCLVLLDRAWTRRVRIRHMRLICERSGPAQIQATLFSQDTKATKQTSLMRTMDMIRSRFGNNAITPALTLEGEKRAS
jgi:DNA polymerase-4